MENMTNHGIGWVRLEYLVPARGLIGFRTDFLTETRGTGVISHIFEDYEPWFGEIRARDRGSIVADRTGPTTTYAMTNLQERCTMMVGPGTDVYMGMIVGENSRAGDMDVNICREKKLTNVRASSSDDTIRLTPHRGCRSSTRSSSSPATSASRSRPSTSVCARCTSIRATAPATPSVVIAG